MRRSTHWVKQAIRGVLGAGLVAWLAAGCASGQTEGTDRGGAEPTAHENAALSTGCITLSSGLQFCAANLGLAQANSCTVTSGGIEPIDTPDSPGGLHIQSNGKGVAEPGYACPCNCAPGQTTDSDGVTFAYLKLPTGQTLPGNLEVTVRVASLTNSSGAEAGIMVRSNPSDAASPMAAVHYKAASLCGNALGRISAGARPDPNASGTVAPPLDSEGGPTRAQAPFYMKFSRIGADFALYYSIDNVEWIPLETYYSSGKLPTTASQAVGFFLASGTGQTVDAVFDHINVNWTGTVNLPWTTSWIGSSFNQLSTDFVSYGMHGLYVGPNGWSYKYSQAAEQGHQVNIFDQNGALVPVPADLGGQFAGVYEGGITGEGQRVYMVRRDSGTLCGYQSAGYQNHIEIRDDHLVKLGEVPATPADGGAPDPFRMIRGLAVKNGKLYVSELPMDPTEAAACPCPLQPAGQARIRVVDAATGPVEAITSSDVPHPAALAADNNGGIWVVNAATDYPNVRPSLCEDAQAGTRWWCKPYEVSPAPHFIDYQPVVQDASVQHACDPWSHLVTAQDPPGRLPYDATIKYLTKSGGVWSVTKTIDAATALTTSYKFDPVGVTFVPQGGVGGADALLVADNGANQNILLCTLGTTVSCSPWGSSAFPSGLMSDPQHSGDARFYAPLAAFKVTNGATTNYYVGSGAPLTDIRKFNADKSLAWQRIGLAPEAGGFDPASEGQDFYTTTRHYHYNPSLSTPGKWATTSVTADPFNDTLPTKERHGDALAPAGVTSFFVRRLASNATATPPSQRPLFAYQVSSDKIIMYSQQGEQWVPFGSIMQYGPLGWFGPEMPGCVRVWIDANGNNNHKDDNYPKYDPEEHDKLVMDPLVRQNGNPACVPSAEVEIYTIINSMDLRIQGNFVPYVDEMGNIFLGYWNQLWELKPEWPAGSATPRYALANRIMYTHMQPMINGFTPRFDASTNSLYALGGFANTTCGSCTCRHDLVARYDNFEPTNWAPGSGVTTIDNPPAHYVIPLPVPQPTTFDDFPGRFDDPLCGCPGLDPPMYMSLAMTGDKFFTQERWGRLRAFNAHTGVQEATLFSGPETNAFEFWSDFPDMLSSARTSSGEYLLTAMDSSPLARDLFFRWTPPSSAQPPETWTPAALAPRAWYKATDATVQRDASGNVSLWLDSSGHGSNLANDQFPPGRPPYVAAGWNGNMPTVSFDGTKLLRNDAWTDTPAGTSQPFSALAVVQMTAQPPPSQLVGVGSLWDGGAGTVRWGMGAQGTQTLLDLQRVDSNNTQQALLAGPDLGTSRHVVAWRYGRDPGATQDNFRFTVDGTTVSQTFASAPVAIQSIVFIMGAVNLNPNGLFQGNISELVVVPRELTDQEVNAYRTYAQATWGGLTAGSFSPLDLGPSGWYDASVTSSLTVNSAGKVQRWADLGADERMLSNLDPTTGSEPGYQATGWTGTGLACGSSTACPCLNFTAGQLLSRDGWIGPPAGTEQPFTVAAVVQWPTPTTSTTGIVGWGSSQNSSDIACKLQRVGTTSNVQLSASRTSGANSKSFTGTANIAPGKHLVVWTYSNGTYQVKVDNNAVSSGSPGTLTGGITPDMFFVGATKSASFVGQLGEVVVYPKVLAATDLTNLRNYAHAKWGTP